MAEFLSLSPDDPKSLEYVLDAFPPQPGGAQMVPVPPKARPVWAQHLFDAGVRVHPELAVKFPIPGDQPGMGWMNPNLWVSREEFDKHTAPASGDDGPMGEALTLLEAINPDMARVIAGMSDEQKKATVAEQAERIPAVLETLTRVRELMERSGDGS